MNLPEPIAAACAPLFERVPLDQSMSRLVGSEPKHTDLVQSILSDPVVAEKPPLAAALWLYVDDLDRSHRVSQGIEDETGSYWHGIMHRREGDFNNSRYWMRNAAAHPLMQSLDSAAFVSEVESATGDDPQLVARQRAEWRALFEWCAGR